MRVTKTFSLDTEADKDILRWLGAQENVSKSIRQAIRAYQGRGGVTIGDVYQAIKDVDRKLQNGAVNVSPSDDDWNEPPEAAAALEKLGL